MNIKKLLPIILLFIVLACDVFAILTENQSLRYIFKPMLIPLIAWYYFTSTPKTDRLYTIALVLAWLGDCFLLFEEYFVPGLGSFLVAHGIYVYLNLSFIKNKSWTRIAMVHIPFLVYQLALIYLVYPNAGEMLIPVIVYSTIVAIFGTTAVVNYLEEKSQPNKVLLTGVGLLIASDTFLAVRTFYDNWLGYEVFVIVFYVLAQLMICRSFVLRTKTE